MCAEKEEEELYFLFSSSSKQIFGVIIVLFLFFCRKAEELSQLVDIRVGSQSLTALNLTGSCCVVMCIDLAASGSGQPVNKVNFDSNVVT